MNALRMQEVIPTGSVPIPPIPSNNWGLGRVIRVRIQGRPEQVATVVTTSSLQTYRVYLPETNEYVDAEIEWVSAAGSESPTPTKED